MPFFLCNKRTSVLRKWLNLALNVDLIFQSYDGIIWLNMQSASYWAGRQTADLNRASPALRRLYTNSYPFFRRNTRGLCEFHAWMFVVGCIGNTRAEIRSNPWRLRKGMGEPGLKIQTYQGIGLGSKPRVRSLAIRGGVAGSSPATAILVICSSPRRKSGCQLLSRR